MNKTILSILLTVISLNINAANSTCGVRAPQFSPKGGITDSVVAFIKSANTSITLSAYRLTSVPILNALIETKKSKPTVSIRVVVDSSEVLTNLQPLADAGIEVYIDHKHAIHHNKFIIVDSAYIETGSFNYTYSAEYNNAENAIIIACKPIAAQYQSNWDIHKSHSVPLPATPASGV